MALLLSANLPPILLSSAIASVFLNRVAPSYAPVTSHVGNFLILLIGQLSLFLTWKVVIWPKFLSPLRNLPQPKVSLIVFALFIVLC